MKQVFGTITLDPAADLPMDARMEFKPEAFPIEAPAGENTVINWDHFGGVLLQLQITDGQRVFVHGSAVLVAPGVAFAARHVLEPFLSLLSKGMRPSTVGAKRAFPFPAAVEKAAERDVTCEL